MTRPSGAVVIRLDDFRPNPTPPGSGPEEKPWWPWAAGAAPVADRPVSGDTPEATTPLLLPARLSPRPVRVLRGRYARSELAADLAEYGFLLSLLVAVLVLVAWLDLTFADLARLIHGGTR